jgi:hypothetical protein
LICYLKPVGAQENAMNCDRRPGAEVQSGGVIMLRRFFTMRRLIQQQPVSGVHRHREIHHHGIRRRYEILHHALLRGGNRGMHYYYALLLGEKHHGMCYRALLQHGNYLRSP